MRELTTEEIPHVGGGQGGGAMGNGHRDGTGYMGGGTATTASNEGTGFFGGGTNKDGGGGMGSGT